MLSIITLLRDNICPGQKLLGLNVLCDQYLHYFRDNICPGQKLLGLNVLCDQ